MTGIRSMLLRSPEEMWRFRTASEDWQGSGTVE